MRIAMVSEHASPLATLGGADAGGQNVHVAELARHLAAQGHAVDVYTRRDRPDVPERVPLCRGVDVVHVDAGPATTLPKDELLPWMDDMGDELARHWSAAERRPDVVHAHFWMSGLAAVRAVDAMSPATGPRIPVVQTFHALGSVKRRHQGAADTSPPERVALETRLCAEVDMVVATCHDEVDELHALGAEPDRVRVVPCGVDLGRFTPDAHGSTADGQAGLRLLALGRVVERKGIGTVIEALTELPDAELVVAGGPALDGLDHDPEVARLRDLAAALGVEGRVSFVGSVGRDAVPGLLRSADVVVCTPWYEPFGIVPLEAAACGRPVIGSAVGGLLDTVVDGRTGLLVPPRDTDALADAVRRLADPAVRQALGSAARVRAERLYGWGTVARRTADVYAELASTAPAGQPPRPEPGAPAAPLWLAQHTGELVQGLEGLLDEGARVEAWGRDLADRLLGGARLLVAGNGGSAAEAQHLTAELVGRFEGERVPLSAIALHAETSSTTAIVNDYGADEIFARQVAAHGRPGDVLLALSTSGSSRNVIAAVHRARQLGLTTWALTGPAPNPLAAACDEAIAVPAGSTSAVQEVHLVAVHALCAAIDAHVERLETPARLAERTA